MKNDIAGGNLGGEIENNKKGRKQWVMIEIRDDTIMLRVAN